MSHFTKDQNKEKILRLKFVSPLDDESQHKNSKNEPFPEFKTDPRAPRILPEHGGF